MAESLGGVKVRDTAFFSATAMYLVAIMWAYMNRDSEKIVTTLFLGVTALIGSLLAVALFGSEPAILKVFSTPIMIDAKTGLPFEGLPYPALPVLPTIGAREKLKAHPELIPDLKVDPFAQTLYHHLLQRAIVNWLEEKYPSTWEADVFPMSLGESSGYMFQSKQVPSRLYPTDELTKKMADNKFGDIMGPFGDSKAFGLAVPEGTELEISAPHMDASIGEVSALKLRNRLCTITVETRRSMSMVGAGSYRLMLGLNQEQAQQAIRTDQYIVVISASFNRFLSGHPEMPKYKKWASDITNGLEAQFDERAMWDKSKEWLLVHRGTTM
jgi:hypothetical protein